MSMGVDLSTPLTPDEAAYLQERGRHQELEAAAERHGQDVNELLAGSQNGDGTAPHTMPLNTDLRQIEEPGVLLARLREMGYDVEVKEAAPDEDQDDETAPPYETWKSADINTEIDRRNVGREDGAKISKAGTVQDRAERLYADDEQNQA